MGKNFIITLGRQYGAGGREIGEILSEKLSIRYLDKELLRMVSDQSGIEESYFHVSDEKPGDNLVYRFVKSMTPDTGKPSMGSNLLAGDNLFRFQKEVIEKVADSGESCVIVGRCADFILKDYEHLISVFVYADESSRKERIVRRTNYKENEVSKIMKKMDKERMDYYHYYTGKNWSDPAHYDLCFDSGKLGAEKCADLIIAYLKLKGFLD